MWIVEMLISLRRTWYVLSFLSILHTFDGEFCVVLAIKSQYK